ncbi:PAS domain S-box-containing protein [Actinokineospora baliensis]|uniref:GAF domain-containing sensor histidine kinase n=1 Tax=Actinokineospora baliensis TaxID=547056 RepID=UPI00195918FC|nr:ATP-binding protein [Actinokineospora baliensis]MBM7775205.1 PAS domain S-box-containing protein [Actinokineospora baliensis]
MGYQWSRRIREAFLGDESARLAALHEYGVLDTPADAELAAVVRVAAVLAGVPTATLNLLDEHRQCQLTTVGFEGADSARSDSMCQVVVDTGLPVHVADASLDHRFAANPWVTGQLARVRGYASVPLITPDGHVLGTLCAFDTMAREFTDTQITAMEDLATVVLALFERRKQARTTAALAVEAQAARTLAEGYAGQVEARQELTDAVHESIDVAIVVCDETGRLSMFNRAAREWHGLDPDAGLDSADWAGRYSLFARDGRTPLAVPEIPLFRALHEGKVVDQEIVIARVGRPPVRVVCTGRAMRRADGSLLGAVVAMSDVTVERAQRRELADRERLLTTVLDTAQDAFVVTDPDGVVTRWNPAAEAMFGWTSIEAVGRRLEELVFPQRADGESLLARAALGSTRLVRVPARRRDGTGLLVELSLAPFTWQGEKRFHAFLRDVTEREAARERLAMANSELAAANDELDRFTAMVAHDLKSPLTAISAYAEVFADSAEHGPSEAKAISAITRAAHRMTSMIDDLLDHARACHEPLSLRSLDLDTVVDDLAAELRAARDHVTITRDHLPAVPAHPTLLRQVMANLLGNAVKYVAPGVDPRVHVSAETTDGWVTLRITDNGIGISEESRDKVFALFHREHAGAGYQGTGIGLSTCKRIIDRHGGRIWIEPAPGGGTRACFTIPSRSHTAPPQRAGDDRQAVHRT